MKNKVIILSSESLGRGDEDLGRKVMGTFISTLLTRKVLPKAIVMMNSSVKLAVKGSISYDALCSLEEAGVQVLACLTCLKHYELETQVEPHRVTSMDAVVDFMSEYEIISL